MSVKRYDFDCYAFYDSARLSVNECEDGDYVIYSDYADLLARHNALVEAVHKAMDRTADCDKKQTDDQIIADVAYLKRLASDHFKTSVDCGNRAFAAEQKYDALREAVAWERECRDANMGGVISYATHHLWLTHGEDYLDAIQDDYEAICDAARAELDRLAGGE